MDKKKHKAQTHRNIYAHLTQNSLLGLGLILIALSIGMWGYHHFEHMTVVNSFVNASMILSGMGPVTPLLTTGGKIFAGCYALFSGLAFIAIIVLMLSPIFHVFFRKIHLDIADDEG